MSIFLYSVHTTLDCHFEHSEESVVRLHGQDADSSLGSE